MVHGPDRLCAVGVSARNSAGSIFCAHRFPSSRIGGGSDRLDQVRGLIRDRDPDPDPDRDHDPDRDRDPDPDHDRDPDRDPDRDRDRDPDHDRDRDRDVCQPGWITN